MQQEISHSVRNPIEFNYFALRSKTGSRTLACTGIADGGTERFQPFEYDAFTIRTPYTLDTKCETPSTIRSISRCAVDRDVREDALAGSSNHMTESESMQNIGVLYDETLNSRKGERADPHFENVVKPTEKP